MAEEHKLSLKSWVGGCRLRSRKKPPGKEADEHRWGKMKRETGRQITQGLLKKRSLGFHSREGGDMVESAFLENEVGDQVGGGTWEAGGGSQRRLLQ